MKIKINNDYKCFMSIPNINFWYDYEGRKLFIGWLWWGIDLIFKGYEKQGKETSWKPSKEEMDVLYGLAYITNQYDEHKEEVITRLYQDLKREFFNGSSYENMFPIEPCIQEGDKLVTNEDGTHFNISQLERVAVSEDLENMSYHSAMKLINDPKFLPTTTFSELIPMLQKLYKDGVEWADETMLNKACEWLKENMGNYIIEHPFFPAGSSVTVEEDKMVEDFRKAMRISYGSTR